MNRNLWGYDYIDGELVVNEREADMVRRVYRFMVRLDKYDLPFNDAAYIRLEKYWIRLKKRAGIENVSKPSPDFWKNERQSRGVIGKNDDSKLLALECAPLISADLFEKVAIETMN
ncbi:hypothetical protein [Paenibacillus sp. NAIST15-1]|uniref:hypothetical protein n=1 Tax=Paenibacillus sp. NAIST15-1 TaxID=1605994 RepID=UPI00086BB9EC|nr:hypothetical protein [Paenibacillus sp. NAIST15-1]GAV11363.1 hypothetical protein PBN151_1290 [Paenibacillus sp. NAIST15-1]